MSSLLDDLVEARNTMSSLLDDLVEARNKELKDALDALAWLAGMAGYAQHNLDAGWKQRNGGDFANALDQANDVLSKYWR